MCLAHKQGGGERGVDLEPFVGVDNDQDLIGDSEGGSGSWERTDGRAST